MLITREMIVRELSERTGFYQRDVRILLTEFDNLFEELYERVDDDEDLLIQLLRGLKVGCRVFPEKECVDPRNQQPIICRPKARPFAKWSRSFKEIVQKQYDNKHDGSK